MHIVFHCKNGPALRDSICEQLVGNQDFINNNIVVSDIEPNMIGLYVSSDCTTDPEIHINTDL